MEDIQVLINSLYSSPNFEKLKGQLVVALTEIYQNGGGGGGVESVTGDLVNNTDPANPVVNLPYKSFLGYFSQGGTNNPVITTIYNNSGRSLSITRIEQGICAGTLSGSVVDSDKLYYSCKPLTQSFIEFTIDGGNNVVFAQKIIDFDALSLVSSDGFDTFFEIRIYE